MSLFGNDEYQWRETYFVLFRFKDRPVADDVVAALKNDHNDIIDVRADESGLFESLTVKSPDDSSGMDITFVTGEEVTEHVEELLRDLVKSTLTDEDREKLNLLGDCDSRFDIFHFEQISFVGDEEDEILDPGSLLLVLEAVARLCRGVGIDPQSGSLIS